MTREDLVKLVRVAVEGVNRPSYCKNPASFDPHEWVLDAMKAAYLRGQREAQEIDPAKDRDVTIGDSRPKRRARKKR